MQPRRLSANFFSSGYQKDSRGLSKIMSEETNENNNLRYLLARLAPECVYCGLENYGLCRSGFPGCAKADDLGYETDELKVVADKWIEKLNTRAENPRIAELESNLEYLNRWKTLIERAPEFEVQKIAVERFLKTDGMRPFLESFKTRIKELESENFAQSDLIEKLQAEVVEWKRLAGKKAI